MTKRRLEKRALTSTTITNYSFIKSRLLLFHIVNIEVEGSNSFSSTVTLANELANEIVQRRHNYKQTKLTDFFPIKLNWVYLCLFIIYMRTYTCTYYYLLYHKTLKNNIRFTLVNIFSFHTSFILKNVPPLNEISVTKCVTAIQKFHRI